MRGQGSDGSTAALRVRSDRLFPVARLVPLQAELRAAALQVGLTVLPLALLQCAVDAATAELLRRHPSIPERLARWHGASVLIKPADTSVSLVLDIAEPPLACRLRVMSSRETVATNARIEGPLVALIDLLEGRSDGDALFFARDLAISGDTELIVGLRNALDGTEIDMLDGVPEPLAAAARAAADIFKLVVERTGATLESWRSWLVNPAPTERATTARVTDGLRSETQPQPRSDRRP